MWELLLSLPTQVDMEKAVLSAIQAPASKDAPRIWAKLLDPAQWHKSMYVLQIIDAFLKPSDECGGEIAKFAGGFKAAFIQSGGFLKVLELFMMIMPGNAHSAMTGMGNAVALRIVKACMFGDDDPDSTGSPDGKGVPSETPSPAQDAGGATSGEDAAMSSPPPAPPATRSAPTQRCRRNQRAGRILPCLMAPGPPLGVTTLQRLCRKGDYWILAEF